MDIGTLVGIIAGLGLVLTAILTNSGLGLFWNPAAAMIVVGGTFAATLVAFPLKDLLKVMGLFMKVFFVQKSDQHKLIETMVEVSHIARKGGVLAIEGKIKEINSSFLRKGLQLTVDGKDEMTVVSLLKREIGQIQKSHKEGWEIFNEMGKFAPAFGMIGTLIGLIQLLADMNNVASLGPKMAVALVTTFYGAALANMVFIPMTVKLKRRSATETLEMNLALEGITYIRKGMNPRFMKEILENSLAVSHGRMLDREEKVKPEKV
jgi:chemotaxis protein MotA